MSFHSIPGGVVLNSQWVQFKKVWPLVEAECGDNLVVASGRRGSLRVGGHEGGASVKTAEIWRHLSALALDQVVLQKLQGEAFCALCKLPSRHEP